MKLPAHLIRKEEVIEPDVDLEGAKRIGEVTTEVLEYTPGELYVRKPAGQAGPRSLPEIFFRLPPKRLRACATKRSSVQAGR